MTVARVNRVTQLLPYAAWDLVLADFRETFPEIRCDPNTLKAHLRYGLEIDRQPPRPTAPAAPISRIFVIAFNIVHVEME